MTPGQVAYQTWAKGTDVEHFLLPWRSLTDQEKVAWEEAAQKVMETFAGQRWDADNITV